MTIIKSNPSTILHVDEKVLTTKFACDYEKCKGACCWQAFKGISLGGFLSDDEAANVLYYRKQLSELCDKDEQSLVLKEPIVKDEGLFYTALHGHKCVLCNMDKGCVLKTAKQIGLQSLDIPLSCQLYPLLWEYNEDGTESLSIGDYYGEYCTHAYRKGEAEGIFLLDFLKEPLIKAFGESIYNRLKELQKHFI